MDTQPQDNIFPETSVIAALYRTYCSARQENPHDRHGEERKAANNAEDALFNKLTEELRDELRRAIFLRAEVTELDAVDLFADGFRLGAKLILDILHPEKPG